MTVAGWISRRAGVPLRQASATTPLRPHPRSDYSSRDVMGGMWLDGKDWRTTLPRSMFGPKWSATRSSGVVGLAPDRRIARLGHTAAGCPTTSTGIVGNEPSHWRIPDRLSPPTGLSCRKSAAAIDAINALLSNGDSPYSPSGIHRLHIRSTYAVLYRTRFPTFPVGPRCTQECLTAVPGRTAVTVHCSMGALPTLLSIGRTPRASKSLIVSCADACTSEAAIDGADVPTLSTVATNATTTLLKILPLSKAISLRY